jgi:hypothetical protein
MSQNEDLEFESVKSGTEWNPKNPELKHPSSIIGAYVGFKENVGKHNSTVHYIISRTTAEKVFFWGSGVLDSMLAENVVAGQTIKVDYLGKATAKDGKTEYHNWDVLVAKNAEMTDVSGQTMEEPKKEEPVTTNTNAAIAGGGDDSDLPF